MSRSLRPLVLAAALAGFGVASAQTVGINWNPRTGDVWVNTWLVDMNQYGGRYQSSFVDEMVRSYGAPRNYVSSLLGQRGWSPGDVYMACSIAQILGRPCSYVVDQYSAFNRDNPGQGWGVMAQRLGIKPGSAEFHRLKSGMVRSYDRWNRPIALDRDLERDFPGRGNGAARSRDHSGPPAASGNGRGGGHGRSGNGPKKGKGRN